MAQRISLLRTVQRLVANPCTAEDLVQETYLRVARAVAYRPVEHLEPFMFQTARNLALDYLRARRLREQTLLQAVPETVVNNVAALIASPEQAADAERQLRQLYARLTQLTLRQQRVFVLSRVHGCSYLEIAEQLQVSASTVQKDLTLALAFCAGTVQ